MTHFLRFLAIPLLSLYSFEAFSYSKEDSIRIETILAKVALLNESVDKTLFIAREFIGTPYVAGTLDKTNDEELIINTRELDCTTYVETVVALRLCASRGERTFEDFQYQLQRIRYKFGIINYTERLHYFTSWIEENEKAGFVKKIQGKDKPFTAVQHLNVNYMSTHSSSYFMLSHHPEWLPKIMETERSLTGKSYRYIPKSEIKNTSAVRSVIHDGDIIAILTSKKGLDTSHIGIAVWHKDGVHLLNASQIHKKVVEESMLLRTYMQKHPSQLGIRIARLCI